MHGPALDALERLWSLALRVPTSLTPPATPAAFVDPIPAFQRPPFLVICFTRITTHLCSRRPGPPAILHQHGNSIPLWLEPGHSAYSATSMLRRPSQPFSLHAVFTSHIGTASLSGFILLLFPIGFDVRTGGVRGASAQKCGFSPRLLGTSMGARWALFRFLSFL